jgi:hypothetical protein
MSSEISNRQGMADRLQSVMTKSYEDLKDELSLERNHSLLKTYLLEAHTSANSSQNDIFKLLTTAFQEPKGRRRKSDVSVKETDDESLFTVSGTYGRGQFVFYIDTSDKRFWIAHSISKSETSDVAIDTVLNGNSQLDCTWMPMELLETILRSGTSRGLALDFDRRYLDTPTTKRRKQNIVTPTEDQNHRERERNPISSGNHLEYVKMQLWGEGADRILQALKTANLTNSTTISKVRLKSEDEDDEDQFSLADVKFDGKVTGRGTSFGIYNGLLADVLGRYSSAVRGAEKTFRIHWESEGGHAKSFGEPFFVSLGQDGISNLEHFCAKVFSGTEPFRLMGLPVRRNTNFYTVSAIDLHVNQRIDFEVSRKTLSVFLPNKACGNTLLRLYTNLQHYFSSDVKAIDGSGAPVFHF